MKQLCQLYKKIFSTVIIILTLFFVLPMLFGYSCYAIETNSMEPTISPGSIVYVKELKNDEYKLNDIITFSRSKDLITHRIVGIDLINNQLTTKGDGIIYNDENKVLISNVKGKVNYSIPFAGYTLMFLKSIEGIIMGIILIIMYFISIVYPSIMKGYMNNEKNSQ